MRYEDLSAVNERLIYVVLTGYGMEGPERNRSGFDYAAFWARSGLMGMLGQRGGPPCAGTARHGRPDDCAGFNNRGGDGPV